MVPAFEHNESVNQKVVDVGPQNALGREEFLNRLCLWNRCLRGRVESGRDERAMHHSESPRGNCREEAHGNGRGMFSGSGLKGLGRDDQTDPENDRHAGFERNQCADQSETA